MNESIEFPTKLTAGGWTDAATAWVLGNADTTVHVLGETFVRWGQLLEADKLEIEIAGSYLRNPGSLSEDLTFSLTVDGTPWYTFTLAAVASAASGTGTFRVTFTAIADSATAQRLFGYAEVFNPAGTGVAQVFRNGSVGALDFSVDRRVAVRAQKASSTSSVLTITALRARIEGRST